VLEPSPPASTDPAWFADDPTNRADSAGIVVSPVSDGDRTWDEIVGDEPELAFFAADRWLGARRRLQPLPGDFERTRRALHQLAFFVLAPIRHRANGKLGLRYTHRGFGTPFYGHDEQVRVEGTVLVHQVGDEVETSPIATVADAAGFLALPYRETWFDGFHDPPAPVDADAPLGVDEEAAAALADWFGFATAVLEEARRTEGAQEVSRVQLWPEHFDPAVEMGSADDGRRASYGASPGDADHPEPYLYVAAWGDVDRDDPYWNDPHFNGAALPYAALLAAEDQFRVALEFFREGHRRLAG
jgi:hypothetical protein